MVSPADGGNNLIIVVLSGASQSTLELTGFPLTLKKHIIYVKLNCFI